MNSISSHGAEVRSIRKLLQIKYDSVQIIYINNMNIISKITGRDISTEYLALMSGLITNDEFELITLTLK